MGVGRGNVSSEGEKGGGGGWTPGQHASFRRCHYIVAPKRHFTFRHGKVTCCAQTVEQTNCQLVLSPTCGLSRLS